MQFKNKEDIEDIDFACEPKKSKVILKKYSPSRKNAMLVCERIDGTFTYGLYFWDLSDYEYIGHGFWALSSEGGFYSELKSAIKDAELEFKSKL